jgi:hypothetical protein
MPIEGADILIFDPTDPIHNLSAAVVLSVRIPPGLARLTPVIVRYFEQDPSASVGK